MQLMISAFTAPLIVEELDDDHWRVLSKFGYYSVRLGKTIEVPEGFLTDFASVPRLPLVYWLMGGKATKAAVIHDFLYRQSGVSRADADAVFAEAMGVSGQSWWRRGLMWAGLRVGGWTAYKPKPIDTPQGDPP